MPGARTHDMITVVSGAALTPLCYSLLLSQGIDSSSALRAAAIYLPAHLISGIFFSPDLDLDSAIDNRWGPFFFIWRPYMWLVPHRDRIFSHGLIISALLRLLYFYLWVVLILSAVDYAAAKLGLTLPFSEPVLRHRFFEWIGRNRLLAWSFIAGFITGGDAHIIADWLVTEGKGVLRRMGLRLRRDYRGHR